MTDDSLMAQRRRFFAEEIEAAANLKTPGLVEALRSPAFSGSGATRTSRRRSAGCTDRDSA